jgi:hypothetical protein
MKECFREMNMVSYGISAEEFWATLKRWKERTKAWADTLGQDKEKKR